MVELDQYLKRYQSSIAFESDIFIWANSSHLLWFLHTFLSSHFYRQFLISLFIWIFCFIIYNNMQSPRQTLVNLIFPVYESSRTLLPEQLEYGSNFGSEDLSLHWPRHARGIREVSDVFVRNNSKKIKYGTDCLTCSRCT